MLFEIISDGQEKLEKLLPQEKITIRLKDRVCKRPVFVEQ
jgi:hypothetical protein